jgi:hypothetical protein
LKQAKGFNMVPNNILQRTFQIKYGDKTGTCFTLDFDGRQYLITARHLFIPREIEDQTIRIFYNEDWAKLSYSIVGFGEGDVDIAVLALEYIISPLHPLVPTTNGIILGQDAYFLGFPYGLRCEVGALNGNFPIPLVKKACVSMFSLNGPGPAILLLDGQNNLGFSGGPVVFAMKEQGVTSYVAGVISGFRYEWEHIFNDNEKTELRIKYNTGIIIVFAIDYAITLIKANPIGIKIPSSGR